MRGRWRAGAWVGGIAAQSLRGAGRAGREVCVQRGCERKRPHPWTSCGKGHTPRLAPRSDTTPPCCRCASSLWPPQVQAKLPQAQNPGDPWFHLGQENTGTPCDPSNPICRVMGTIHTAYYQLPTGLTCDGITSKCVMQWYWLTGEEGASLHWVWAA